MLGWEDVEMGGRWWEGGCRDGESLSGPDGRTSRSDAGESGHRRWRAGTVTNGYRLAVSRVFARNARVERARSAGTRTVARRKANARTCVRAYAPTRAQAKSEKNRAFCNPPASQMAAMLN